jgi:hypothetical protein
MHGASPAGIAPHFDLPAGDGAIAQDADTPVVQRMPFPSWVSCPEDREFLFGREM